MTGIQFNQQHIRRRQYCFSIFIFINIYIYEKSSYENPKLRSSMNNVESWWTIPIYDWILDNSYDNLYTPVSSIWHWHKQSIYDRWRKRYVILERGREVRLYYYHHLSGQFLLQQTAFSVPASPQPIFWLANVLILWHRLLVSRWSVIHPSIMVSELRGDRNGCQLPAIPLPFLAP